MASEQKQSEVVEMLAEHELAMGRLYGRYGKKFHELKNFWLKLFAEEIEHAKYLRLLNQKIQEGVVFVKANRFNESAIKTSLGYITRLSGEVEEASTNLLKALSLAVDIESALLENNYFEVFEEDCPDIRRTLLFLAEATKDHLDRVKKALEKVKQSNCRP